MYINPRTVSGENAPICFHEIHQSILSSHSYNICAIYLYRHPFRIILFYTESAVFYNAMKVIIFAPFIFIGTCIVLFYFLLNQQYSTIQ